MNYERLLAADPQGDIPAFLRAIKEACLAFRSSGARSH